MTRLTATATVGMTRVGVPAAATVHTRPPNGIAALLHALREATACMRPGQSATTSIAGLAGTSALQPTVSSPPTATAAVGRRGRGSRTALGSADRGALRPARATACLGSAARGAHRARHSAQRTGMKRLWVQYAQRGGRQGLRTRPRRPPMTGSDPGASKIMLLLTPRRSLGS